MNTTTQQITPVYASKVKSHPLFVVAAVAVILFSAVGIGVMTGLIPTANSKTAHVKPASVTATAAEHAQSSAKKAEVAAACMNCGVVQSVQAVEKANEATGLGAVAGGITGAVVGHQIGEGQGKSLATVAAAVGGAFAGNKIEQNMRKSRIINVNVRMEDDTVQTMKLTADPGLLPGDKVKIVDGVLVRRR